MRRVLILLFLMLPAIARAQATVTVTLSPDGQALASQIGVTPTDLADKIKAQIDDAYGTVDINKFLRSFTDATAFSMRGMGVDYMSLPHNFMLGVGGQVALATDGELSAKERPTAGFAANLSIMAGINLGDWGHPRWTLFGNGFYRNGSTERLKGGILTAGAHIQYRLVEPQQDQGVANFLRWTGVDVTSGIEFTRWTLGANDTITTDFTVDGSAGSSDIVVDSVGRFDLTSTATTVPIEITTGLRIALLVSLYVGAGFDLTHGNSSLDANLTGTMHTATDNRDVGTVTIAGSGSNTASPGTGRALAGVQINLWKLKVYTQVNVSPQPAASVGFGVRLVL